MICPLFSLSGYAIQDMPPGAGLAPVCCSGMGLLHETLQEMHNGSDLLGLFTFIQAETVLVIYHIVI